VTAISKRQAGRDPRRGRPFFILVSRNGLAMSQTKAPTGNAVNDFHAGKQGGFNISLDLSHNGSGA
jgi:hypothetical protein